MKILIAEDDFITGQVMMEILNEYGICELAVDGAKAIDHFKQALISSEPYNVVFLDIMMPEKTGQEVLAEIKILEDERGIRGLDGVKIIMTTALDDFENIKVAFHNQCDGYIVKPIDVAKIESKLSDLGLI
jgi:two-component system chemotaxis response regulator CheY